MLSEKTRENGHRPKFRKFSFNTRKSFFTIRVTDQTSWGVSVLGNIQNPTGHCLEHPALDNPALSRVVEPDSLQRPLSTSTTLWLCESFSSVIRMWLLPARQFQSSSSTQSATNILMSSSLHSLLLVETGRIYTADCPLAQYRKYERKELFKAEPSEVGL